MLALVGAGLLAAFLWNGRNGDSAIRQQKAAGSADVPRATSAGVPQDPSAGVPRATSVAPPGNGMPTIEIEALRVVSTPGAADIVAGSLTEKIRDAFARFATINVVSAPQPGDSGAAASTRADYRLSGSVQYGATTTRALFRLLDVSDGIIAWTQAFEYPNVATDRGAPEDEIVVSVADALLQFYGVIYARDRARQLASRAGDPRYRCVLDATEYIRSYEPAAYDRVRSCLEQLTAIDPSFAIGFELLAFLYVRESNLNLPAHVGDPPALDRALRAARHAIELNPASARAYLALFVVLYSRRDVAAAFAAGDKALALNRYDLITVAEYGGRLIMTGEVERGMRMLKRAGDAGSIRPTLHDFYLFLGNYLQGDMKEAAFHAAQITADNFPYGLVARAIADNRAGNVEQARMAIERLVEVQPSWRNDARGELAKQILKPEIVDSLLRDLAAAGLAGAP
ncbi:MAG TPA: hypothetical protein VGH49_01215 [Xanthobacteraceae bacterium]